MDFPLVFGMYAVEIGLAKSDPNFDGNVYIIKNMETGVLEAETSSLPRAIMSAAASNLEVGKLLSNAELTLQGLAGMEKEFNSKEVPEDDRPT